MHLRLKKPEIGDSQEVVSMAPESGFQVPAVKKSTKSMMMRGL